MKIAIIGAGLAGMAVCWELSRHAAISLFDPLGIGGGASGIAPGLLHPYGGMRARKSWRADQGMEATRELLQAAFPDPFRIPSGILRLVTLPEQHSEFQRAALNEDVEWWPAEKCRDVLPGSQAGAGIWIRSGLTVPILPYLQALWKRCEQSGAHFFEQMVDSLDELQAFDCVVLTTGGSRSLLPDPQIGRLKGQILTLRWPEGLSPPPMSLIAKKYLVMNPDHDSCLVGATFEREFEDEAPDLEFARAELIPAIAELYPPLADAEILDCKAAVRATSPHHRPAIQKISERCWAIRGLGSKGLLYHALLSKELVAQLGFR